MNHSLTKTKCEKKNTGESNLILEPAFSYLKPPLHSTGNISISDYPLSQGNSTCLNFSKYKWCILYVEGQERYYFDCVKSLKRLCKKLKIPYFPPIQFSITLTKNLYHSYQSALHYSNFDYFLFLLPCESLNRRIKNQVSIIFNHQYKNMGCLTYQKSNGSILKKYICKLFMDISRVFNWIKFAPKNTSLRN